MGSSGHDSPCGLHFKRKARASGNLFFLPQNSVEMLLLSREILGDRLSFQTSMCGKLPFLLGKTGKVSGKER